MQMFEAARDSVDEWSGAEERALLAAAPDDPAAFAELYRRHVEAVFHYLLTHTDSEDEAADLTQHVFLRAMHGLTTYRGGEERFRAWLIRVARNAAIDAYRRRRHAIPWEQVPETLQPVLDEDPARLVVRRESLNRLRSLVAGLSREKQDLLALRFAAGLTAGEIAAVLGANEEAVQKRLWRTLCQLRERYDERD